MKGHVDPRKLGEYRMFRNASHAAADACALLDRIGRPDLIEAMRDAQSALKEHAHSLRVEVGE